MFGQTFEPHDLLLIGLLVVLEGVLSIDNALVLGLLARKLPKSQQRRALTYGLVGAFVFRVIAIALAAYLFRWRVVKLVGGAYLVYVAVKHFFFEHKDPHGEEVELGPDGMPILRDEATGGPLPEDERRRVPRQRLAEFGDPLVRRLQFWCDVEEVPREQLLLFGCPPVRRDQ